jgi:hypothetical protein
MNFYIYQMYFFDVLSSLITQFIQGNETLFLNWQKDLWQTFEETSGCVRRERVNKWPNSMTDTIQIPKIVCAIQTRVQETCNLHR